MESEEGYETAKSYNEAVLRGADIFLGEQLNVVKSPEPSDIIWEN